MKNLTTRVKSLETRSKQSENLLILITVPGREKPREQMESEPDSAYKRYLDDAGFRYIYVNI
ncbi:hypothetical protein LF817_11340 [Halobacillus sp. A1]|uniref:hypothetical protein n=1 Tax=Halobacillus sp. A1 TaxID=2880262 RepID=UPI0020A6AA1A|nr:hypothetical protein [Halobacillus sp. A1]MCP3031939.1 hypothetical protein [Halobacillus sp. A1]